MEDRPKWIQEKIEFKEGYNLQQGPVVDVFLESPEPYLSRQQVQNRLKGDHSKSTVQSRLNELVGIDILDDDKVGGSTMYWCHNEDSEWPIPPDVEVEPVSEEMTVQEFFNKRPVVWGIAGVAANALAGLVIWMGAYLASNSATLLGVSSETILAGGLSMIFFGWLAILLAIIFWFREESPPG